MENAQQQVHIESQSKCWMDKSRLNIDSDVLEAILMDQYCV